MLSRHAHSALAASDTCDARARQHADRMEMGRRARSHALLGSADARRDEDGALRRRDGHHTFRFASRNELFASTTNRTIGPAVQHACDCEPRTGRIHREHGRCCPGECATRTRSASRAHSRGLTRRTTYSGIGERHVLFVERGSSRRAHAGCGDHGSTRYSRAKQRACHVLRATDFDCQSAGRTGIAQSATPAPRWVGKQQATVQAADVCRPQWCTDGDRRSADEPSAEETKALIESAFSSHRASRRDDLIPLVFGSARP